MILRQSHRIDFSPVYKAHERKFRTGKEFLYDNLALAELVVQEHVFERFHSLFKCLWNDNSFSCCKSVIFEHDREKSLPDIFHGSIKILKCLECSGRNVIFCHKLLGEVLAGFDSGCSL